MSKSDSPYPPLTVWLFFGLAWILGVWLVGEALHRRIFGLDMWDDSVFGIWAGSLTRLGVAPQLLSWIFLDLGLGLIAAAFGVYLRQRWGYWWGLLTALLLGLQVGWGTPLALACLATLLARPTRMYLESDQA